MEKSRYLNQVDRFYKGLMRRAEIFDFGNTPEILQRLGIQPHSLRMKQGNFRKCTRAPRGSRSAHSLSRNIMENLPEHLGNPVMIIDDPNKKGILLLTELRDSEANFIVVAIHTDQMQGRGLVNEIKSVYGKNHLYEYLIRQSENIVYEDTKRAKALFREVENQYLQTPNSLDYLNNISDSSGNVKNFQKNLEGGWIPQDTGKENQSSKMQSTQEALRKERLMYDVKLGKKTIATFESQEDAKHFSDWKKFSLRQERFFRWEENYRKEHSVEPTTAEAEEELSEIAQNLENEVIMGGEEKALKEQGVEKPVATNRIKLTLPKGLEPDARIALERQLYKEGARYQKYTIPAEKSYTGAEINGKSWYVNPDRVESLEPFREYIKDSQVIEKEVPNASSTVQEGALTEKEVIKELRENGFRPTMSLTDRLTLLNEKAGKSVHLADVKEMLSADAQIDGEVSEMRELAEGIAEECKAQEIAMQAMEVELE